MSYLKWSGVVTENGNTININTYTNKCTHVPKISTFYSLSLSQRAS